MSRLLMCGDIHGDFKPVRALYEHMFKTRPLTEEDVLICLGDFGANFFFNHRDEEYKKKLGKYKITYFVIRGNHEERPSLCMEKNPEKWHTETFWNNQVFVENDYPYIKYALDRPAGYEIPTAQGTPIKTLVLPGAYSVDKYLRIANNWSWFPQEQCNKEEMEIGVDLAESDKWDLVLSHTCPIIYEPTDLFLSVVDQSTVDKTTERWLGGIEYSMDYKLWCWGHYHSNRVYPKVENKEKLMLFNDCFLDVYKFFCGNYSLYNSLIKVKENTNIDDFNLLFK